jgi:hypothetical protein
MQITMEALEQALAPIEAVGKGEIDFKVNGITVTLRRLLPEEESEAQKFAVNRSDDESSNALEYIQRFKLAILSYALVAIGSLNLRDVQYVETGETLEIEGTGGTPKKIVPVKILRHVAMRQMLIKWAAPARIAMFQQYAELLNRVEDLAEEMVELAPSNLGVEIERLEQRLAKLRERQSSEKESLESDVSKLVKTIHQTETSESDSHLDDAEMDEQEIQEPIQAPVQAQSPVANPMPRQSAIPQAARPTVQAAPVAQPRQNPNPADYAAGMETPDSFVDMGDSGSMEDAINAENLRMLHRRQAVARGQDIPDSPSVLSAAHSMRRPPHLAARGVTGELDGGELADELLHTGRTVDGVDTYRMSPPEDVGSTIPRMQRPVTPKGVNPRFTPPKKP